MATVLYTDVRYYGPHFESMAAQWRQIDAALNQVFSSVAGYFRNRAAKAYLRELPEYLLEDIGVSRRELG